MVERSSNAFCFKTSFPFLSSTSGAGASSLPLPLPAVAFALALGACLGLGAAASLGFFISALVSVSASESAEATCHELPAIRSRCSSPSRVVATWDALPACPTHARALARYGFRITCGSPCDLRLFC